MRLRKKRCPPNEQGLRRENLVCWRVAKSGEVSGVGMHPQGTPDERNLVVVLNASMTDQTNAHQKASLEGTGPSVMMTTRQSESHQLFDQRIEVKEEPATQLLEAQDEMGYQQGHWTNSETLILLEAKRKEHDMFSGSRRSVLTADDKWKFVSDFCRTKGVLRSKEQCRLGWENILPDYRKVKEHEEQKQKGLISYFDMDKCDRKVKLLPPDMNVDVFQQIDAIMSSRPTKGGLSGMKREAREKKFVDVGVTKPLEAVRQIANSGDLSEMGAVGIIYGETGAKGEGIGARAREACRRNDASEVESIGAQFVAGRKRRRRKKNLEMAAEDRSGHLVQPKFRNNSSTEEDDIIAGRSEGPFSGGLFVCDENVPRGQMLRMNSTDAAYRQWQICQNHGGSSSAPREEKGPGHCEVGNGRMGLTERERNAELLAYIEDRKDARHKELLALEREKLSVLRDASVTIANALNNAISIFANIAEELLRHR